MPGNLPFSFNDIEIKHIDVQLKSKQALPFHTKSGITKYVILIICTQGKATFEIDGMFYTMTSNKSICIFPYQKANVTASSNDFCCMQLTYSIFYLESLSINIPFLFFLYWKDKSLISLNKNLVDSLEVLFSLLKDKIKNKNTIFYHHIILNILHNIYYELCNFLHHQYNMISDKNETVNNFLLLVKKHMKERKDVNFYANKLCITPNHLNRVIKKNMGNRTAKEWIDYLLITEIKKTLRNQSIRMKEIAEMFGFSSQFLFFQYFKKNVGMSPNEYRKINHNLY
ncbi:MAG: helix-turn-helix domain-containing protein [Bacteroidales bacterium]|jgi:YesN/AraC family two-component response regulator|nr:helix-turn-helix domain-containing protein [Bacteroidales bacterium]MDD3329844.1 helix-turn-helix domain-containing protein [Bacteroidales bacterium]MDD4043961.1 helix-turn-helix domain-containing protein [Bacteroidales bacterium]MDD4581091.1 helix-turn-helix domain-containing protein [Bacteroidales bacterium]